MTSTTLANCNIPIESRRRHFWTTQPIACGTITNNCRDECAVPGLQLDKKSDGATFATNDWVRSLLLNIFSTESRKPQSNWGNVPGQQGGHWSESYGDGTYVGTRLYVNAPIKSLNEAIKLLTAAAQADAYKLVTYGVASAVEVTTKYLGNLRVNVEINVTGPHIVDGRVNLKAQRLENRWAWEA